MKGLRKYLTPFAPDQSGAVSVLYELGGILIICDAGGCAGNICGFDEPRWTDHASAIFSAGLRDMDAIMGRDDRLVEKLADAASKLEANFAAVIGTPVPSVIATDYHGLKRMAERKVKMPILTVDTTGMELYDRGAEKVYEELFRRFTEETLPVEKGRIGVLGVNPLDLSDRKAGDKLTEILKKEGWNQVDCYGMGAGLDRIASASAAERNLVVSPSGLKTAQYLQKKFGTPFEVRNPLAAEDCRKWTEEGIVFSGKRILVVGQQVSAETIRQVLENMGSGPVTTATWFMKKEELSQEGDIRLLEEDQFEELMRQGRFDMIIGDSDLWPMVPDTVETVDMPQFSISGKLADGKYAVRPTAEGTRR